MTAVKTNGIGCIKGIYMNNAKKRFVIALTDEQALKLFSTVGNTSTDNVTIHGLTHTVNDLALALKMVINGMQDADAVTREDVEKALADANARLANSFR